MKKLLKIALASSVILLLSTGCNSDTQTAEESMSGGTELTLHEHTTSKKLHEAIIKAGEAEGFKMTEFKSNAIIAEKVDGDDSASATITFSKDKVIIMQETGSFDASALLDAINEELNSEEHH